MRRRTWFVGLLSVAMLTPARGFAAAALAGTPPTCASTPYQPGVVEGYLAFGVWPRAPGGGPGGGPRAQACERLHSDREGSRRTALWGLNARAA